MTLHEFSILLTLQDRKFASYWSKQRIRNWKNKDVLYPHKMSRDKWQDCLNAWKKEKE